MLFCSTSLAARIERAECTLVSEAAHAVRRRDPSVLVRDLAGGVAVFTGPGSPLNKVAGLGFGGAIDVDALADIEAAFAARGAAVQAEVSTLADPAVVGLLTRRGYALVGFENVLGRALSSDAIGAPSVGIDVSRLAAGELDLWIDTLVTGFASPDAQGVASTETVDRAVVEPVIRDFGAADSVLQFLARRGGEVYPFSFPPGRYRVEVDASMEHEAGSASVELLADATTPFTLELPALRPCEIRMRLPEGRHPPYRARAQLRTADGEPRDLEAWNGFIRVGLLPGSYTIAIDAEGCRGSARFTVDSVVRDPLRVEVPAQ